MALLPLQFAAQSYVDRSPPVSTQDLVNLYLQANPQGTKGPVTLHGTPGLRLFASPGSGPIRGMICMGGDVYVVSGAQCYRVDSAGTATLLGSISGLRPVSMAQNGTQVAIASDFDMYYATSSGVGLLSENNCLGVTVLDGYGIFARRDSQSFFISSINDFSTFDGTEFALANAYPDNLVTVYAANRELWVFGEESYQIYYNSGAADFPFTRIPSGVYQRGCLSARSVADYQGVLFFLGNDRRVYTSQGYQAVPISTHAIEKALASYESPEAAQGFVYAQEGHVFYVLKFTEATWCYDVVTGLWHRRESNELDYWRATTTCYAFGKTLLGDALAGYIYEADLDYFSDNTETLARTAVTPPIFAGGARATMAQVVVEFETGVGLGTGQGSDPQAMLQWSDDGGRTWSNEHWASIGAIGQYRARAKWTRLGQFRERTLRITVSDPVKIAITGAETEIYGGDP